MVLLLFLFGIFFVCMAMLWTEGLWSNVITYVNVIIAGMVAVAFWEPAANALQDQMPTFRYMLDIIAVWGVFVLTLGFLRGVTAALSKTKVRFHRLTESIGNIVMAIIVAATMTAFAGWTLHMAPLAPAPFRGANLNGSFLANVWGRAMTLSSNGTMSGGNAFSQDQYRSLYGQRRQELSALEGFRTQSSY